MIPANTIQSILKVKYALKNAKYRRSDFGQSDLTWDEPNITIRVNGQPWRFLLEPDEEVTDELAATLESQMVEFFGEAEILLKAKDYSETAGNPLTQSLSDEEEEDR